MPKRVLAKLWLLEGVFCWLRGLIWPTLEELAEAGVQLGETHA